MTQSLRTAKAATSACDRASFSPVSRLTLVFAALLAICPPANAALIYGITFDNNLFSFDSAQPNAILSGVYVSGLVPNEFIQAIDFRPSNNVLYALGSANRLYTLDTTTGAASLVGAFGPPVLSGTAFGMTFDPVADVVRVHSDTDQNLRLNPNTGAIVSVDANLFYATGDPGAGQNPSVVASTYASFPVQGGPWLYSLDSVRDTLNLHQNPPGLAQMVTVAALTNASNGQPIDLGNYTGMDDAPIAGSGLAFIHWNNASALFGTLNLATGQVSGISTIGGGLFVRDIAVFIPEPAWLAVMSFGLCALSSLRRMGR